ncbi:MAG: alpha-hydroxy acid oxidase [Ilumatobacteraceae bacterium]
MISTLRSVARFSLPRFGVSGRLSRAANVADLRGIARRRLPGGIFDYIDGAAEDEVTLRSNVDAFASWRFVPRVLRDVSSVDTSTTLFGRSLPVPLILSPTGFSRIADSQGELAVARSAARHELPYCLSTLSTRSIEEVASVSNGDKWFQVYVWRDRGLTSEMLTRASAAGYSTIAITVDTPVLGRRERDTRRGFTLPPTLGLSTIVDGIRHPGWTWDFVRGGPITFSNIAAHAGGGTAVTLSEFIAAQFDPSLSWDDIAWFRERWSGSIVIKGIQSVDDASLAVHHGVDGVMLSNHGGRQLDHAPAPIDLVAPVRDAVGDSLAVICDGGIRRGSDVVKALALGADACTMGRTYLYGLGAAGERGVDTAIEMLTSEMRRTMALAGLRSLGEITRDVITPTERARR